MRKLVLGSVSVLLLLSVLNIAPLGAAAQGSEATGPAFGVQFHATWSDYSDAERTAVLDKLAAAGVEWVRIDFGWPSLQPTGPGAFDSWYLDLANRAVDQARSRGLNVLMTLWRTPDWANGGKGLAAPPSDPADFGRAAGFLAEHFRGRVAAWEIWNEPNGGDWAFTGSAADYTALLRAAYPSIKASDPAALVVAGSVMYNDDDWLRSMYRAGAAGSFDVISTHPYQGMADAPPEAPDDGTRATLAHVAAVHDLMVAYGDEAKPIWFTEFGWSSHPNRGGEENWERGVTQAQQADYLVRTLEFVKARFPYVTNLFWFKERAGNSGDPQLDNYGLLNRDLSEKPAYEAAKAYLTAAPPVGPRPEDDAADANLLINGGFEQGTAGWRASGKLRTTGDTDPVAKVVGRGKRLYSQPVQADAGGVLRASGTVRTAAPGRLQLVVSERRNGRVVKQQAVSVRTARRWTTIPTLRFSPSSTGARIVVSLSATSAGRYLEADDLTLTR